MCSSPREISGPVCFSCAAAPSSGIVVEMASPKYKGFAKKKSISEPHVIFSTLGNENDDLKKTLVEPSGQHSQHNKLLERVLSLKTVRLDSCEQLPPKDEKIALLSKKDENQMDADSASDEWASASTAIELQNRLSDALEKNKQWLEYDQQREAYVRATLARMLWLETQLNEANQALSQKHNEDHSDEKERIRQMQEHYERLLQKAKEQLDVLREELDMSHQNLIINQNWCKERESEVKELRQRLQTVITNSKCIPTGHHCSDDEDPWLTAQSEDLQCKLDEEKRKSANFELQSSLFQKFLLNRHRADQEKIADLERQIKISSQDLEDEKQNCLYLKKQMLRLLKTQKPKDRVTKQPKREQQDQSSEEEAHPPSLCSRGSLMSSTHSSLLNESFLECPSCQAQFPASNYRDLMIHLEICLN
ncbi:centrosomal protein of 55 kDa-like [Plectropomus leopardus]|uniref:centrosomal protein of 55 kDa-like n=1 Tax=Plectropomus leopardus TaxID=160734 RepID=UPI001C4B88DA|nr:centrosomal protein of 55 kDa-like [Plectropomus leopardus]